MSVNETQDNKQDSRAKDVNSRSKKKLFLILLLVAIPIIGFVGYYLYTVSGSIKVGDTIVTRDDFNRRVDAYQSFYDAIGDEEGLTEADRTARDAVLLYYALKQEAEDRNIDVTDEIDEQIQAGIDIRESESRDAFFAHMNQSFNLSEDDLLFNYELVGLKERLAPEILQYRDVLMLSSRYDVVEEGQDDSQQRVSAIKDNLNDKSLSWFESDLSVDDIEREADESKYNNSLPLILDAEPHVIAGVSQGLNKEDQPDYFGSGYFGEDWTAIESLEEDGDYTTEVVESSGGYFAMYRLEAISSGDHPNWDQYINHVKDNAERFGLGAVISYMQNIGIIGSTSLTQNSGLFCTDYQVSVDDRNNAQALLHRIVSMFSSTEVSAATWPCPGTSANHHTGWRGNVKNDAGMNLSGVNVYVHPRPISEQDYTGSHMYCGGSTSANVTTNSSGNFDTGRTFSCYTKWQATYSKDNCTSVTEDLILNAGENGRYANPANVTLTCDPPEATVQIERVPDPDGILTQGDVNGFNVRLRIPATSVNELMATGPSASRVVSVDGDQVRVTGSNSEQYDQRTRSRVCTEPGSCSSWSNWSSYSPGYSDTSRTLPAGQLLRVQIMYYAEDVPEDEPEPEPEPVTACLADPIKTVTFPSRYNQSLSTPGGYSRTYGHQRTRTRTTETRYASHQDASSGGARIQLPHSNDSPGRPGSVDLDYRPYEDNYPFDDNVPRVNYNEDYRRNHYTATGSRVYRDITETREVCRWRLRFVDGRYTIVRVCADEEVVVGQEFLGWRYRYSHATYHTRSDSVNGPIMDPCYDRTFDFNPRISGAQLQDDRESPDVARATAYIDMDYSTEEPGEGRSDVRAPSSVNNFNYQISYRIDGGSWTAMQSGPTNITAPNNNKIINNYPYSPGSVSIPISVPGDLRVGQRVCFRIQTGAPTRGVMDSDGNIQSGSGARSSTSCTPPVVNWPYFKIFGNDVVSGGAFGSCLVSGGRISAHSRGQVGVGSSTQYAAFAVSTINGFSSAGLKPLSADAPVPPTGLTFANMSGNGGNYSANDGSTCLPDYFANEEFSSASTLSGSNAARSSAVVNELGAPNDDPRTLEWFNAGSSLTLSNSGDIPVAQGSRKIIYVDGRLNINDNIIFESNWVSRNDIPFVMLVAREINIAPGVKQIDGVYVAQPGSGLSGTIRTCSTTGSAMFTSCQNPLVVNGSLLAANVQFTRTRGSLRDAILNEGRSGINPVNVGGNCSWTQSPSSGGTVGGDTCAAEIINFAPEVYMALTQLLTPGESFQYDSYVTLPPNL